MQDLKVGIVQFDQKWEDKKANFDQINSWIESIESIDLLLLPEMFHTGFTMNISLSENMDGEALGFLKNLASKNSCAVYTSFICKENEQTLNRGVFVYPNGELFIYDKRKSFGLGGEDQYFTAGKEETILSFKDWNFNLQICYDLRFPELIRNRMVGTRPAYDVLLYVANWPSKRISHWDALLKARAIENQSYVLGCNRVGQDGNNLHYNGHSQAIDLLGNALLEPQEQEGIYVVNLNADSLYEGRNSLPFLRDA
ncbi:MAG: nitrilase-related carbon-nitrogen hydrolase [Flavobacteriales bacterium]